MACHDSIGDCLTLIRNASSAGQSFCFIPYSKIRMKISEILRNEGYINLVTKELKGHHIFIRIDLKYVKGQSAITALNRCSSPGCRVYYSAKNIPATLGGLGVGIISTSRGVLTDKLAREYNLGGEFLATVW
jgi:small subunit ribosomal protein S8